MKDFPDDFKGMVMPNACLFKILIEQKESNQKYELLSLVKLNKKQEELLKYVINHEKIVL